jgi:hypothetical protein
MCFVVEEKTEEVKRKFVERFPETDIPHRKTARRLIKNSEQQVQLKTRRRQADRAVLTDDKIVDTSDRTTQSQESQFADRLSRWRVLGIH